MGEEDATLQNKLGDNLFQRMSKSVRERILTILFNRTAIIIILIIFGFILLKIDSGSKKEVSIKTISAPAALEVLGVNLASSKKLKIVFNDDVDIHQLEHNFVVTPSLGGRIIPGKSKKEFYFENSENFPQSITLLVEINQELVSINNLPFLQSQAFHIQTTIKSNQVTFEKEGIFARVLAGSPGVPISIAIQSGDDIINPTVTVYKSTQGDLINYLLYSVPESKVRKNGKYDSYNAEFKMNYWPHPEGAKVNSFQIKGRAETKTITLDSGIYYLEATKEELPVGSSFLLVSKAGIIFRQDDKKVILSAFDTKTGQKISDNVDAGFYNLRDGQTLLDRRIFKELAYIDTPFDQKLDIILATINGETILVPVKIKDSLADIRAYKDLARDTQMFLYIDRPIYKPGDTVFYRGTVRIDNDALYQLPKEGMKVHVWMNSYGNDNKLYDELVNVDKDGLFSGNFILPDNSTGEYRALYVSLPETSGSTIDYDNYDSASFDVKKYEKPTFELSVLSDKEEYYRHEKISLKTKGTYFNSSPLAKEKIEYSVYAINYYEQEKKVYNQNFNISSQGGMCGGGGFGDYYGEELSKGTVTLDEKGSGEFSLDLKNIKFPSTSQTITVLVSKKDSDNIIQSSKKIVVHASLYSIFFIPAPTEYVVGEEIEAPFYIESLSPDENLPKELEYEIISSNPRVDGKEKKEDLSGKVAVDEKGKGIIKLKAPNILSSSLVIKAQDSNNNKVEVSKYLYISQEPKEYSNIWWGGRNVSQTYLKIVSDSNSYVVGDKIRLQVTSPKDLDVLLSPERGRMYEAKVIHLNEGENTLEIPVAIELSPSIILTFSFFTDAKYYSEGVSLNVPAMHKLLTVQIEKDKDSYKPNETAVLTVIISDAEGNPVSGKFSLGVVDEAIYGLRKDATPLIHSSFYYYRGRSTNASSSLTMIGSYGGGGRGGGGGGGSNGKLIDTLFWAPALETDGNGKAVVPVKLSDNQTVWRAQIIASDNLTNLGQSSTKIQVK